ncbi:hypothetical protein [Roseibium sediminis]|uniref:hypothetical protein n=1 Tax=Roseibium sediminis TaxID=1775174 RepID=UPI00123CDB8A|nr:hypothetical protein [Roseibium sediminis]
MVFSVLILLFFVLAVPLWIYRGWEFFGLPPRARGIFKRLVLRHERAVTFAIRMFFALSAVSAVVMGLVYGLSYLKSGVIDSGSSYKDVVKNRLYTGAEGIDPVLNTYVYDLPLPAVAIFKCLFLAVGFTLVAKALNDIRLIRRLKRRLKPIS